MSITFGTQRRLYLSQTRPERARTTVQAIKPIGQAVFALAVADHVHAPQSGNFPSDGGTIGIDGHAPFPVQAVIEEKDRLWLLMPVEHAELCARAASVVVAVDRSMRWSSTRLHTLSHIFAAVAQHHFSGNATITDQSCSGHFLCLSLTATDPICAADVLQIDRVVREAVHAQRPVSFGRMPSLDCAKAMFGPIFREAAERSSSTRIVLIDGLDVTPCTGLHHTSTMTGPYRLSAQWSAHDPRHVQLQVELAAVWVPAHLEQRLISRAGSVVASSQTISTALPVGIAARYREHVGRRLRMAKAAHVGIDLVEPLGSFRTARLTGGSAGGYGRVI